MGNSPKNCAQTAPQDPPDQADTATSNASTEVVHVPRDTPVAVYQAMDHEDEMLAVQEIAGDLVETMAYEFEVSGKKVRGLSIGGVNHAVQEMAKRGLGVVACPDRPEMRETHDEEGNPVWECTIRAVNLSLGTDAWGIATADQYGRKRNGGVYADTMARRKALSKAQRNAKKQLVPPQLEVEMLANLTGHQVKRIQTRREQAQVQGQQRTQQIAAGATAAAAPANGGGTPATAPQQRMLAAKAKAAELDTKSSEFRAVICWAGGSIHLDRVNKQRVNETVAAIEDWEATLTEVRDAARDDGHPAQKAARWIVENVLNDTPVDGQTQLEAA